MIRLAGISDVPAIQEMIKSIPGLWDENWRSDVVERAIMSGDAIALVHLEGDTIDGFLCSHDVAFRGYLSELVVSPSAQRKGIGGRLLAEAERRLSERGCALVVADVWRDAEGFYLAQGWSAPQVVLLRKRLVALTALSEGDRKAPPN